MEPHTNHTPDRAAAASVDHARAVKAKYEPFLLRMPNVISVGIGLAPAAFTISPAGSSTSSADQPPRRPVLIVCVRQSGAPDAGRSAAIDAGADDDSSIPDELEGVPVTIQVTGEYRAL